jgi:triosephosphate isomerase
MPRKLAAGNWKMHGLRADLAQLDHLAQAGDVDVLICLPATLIAQATGKGIAIGAQDCHAANHGAHTGDLSAAMLADAGASHVLTGHSERRQDHGETDAMVADKSRAAHQAGLTTIICIGETLDERDSGATLAVIDRQLAGSVPDCATAENTIIAYEPVWAIGTGKVPDTAQIAQAHAHIRARLAARFDDGDEFGILYGGSVKAGNAAAIFAVPHVTGALVGGASLKADDFAPIIAALADS